jgi:hypothetical protein
MPCRRGTARYSSWQGLRLKLLLKVLGEGEQMYFRKCLRDTAPFFFLSLGLCLGTQLLLAVPSIGVREPALLALIRDWRAEGFLIEILACVLCYRNISRDISRGSADFLLTRPRSRNYFILIGWVVGIAEIACIVVSAALVVSAILYHQNGLFWQQLPPTLVFHDELVVVDIPLLVVSVFVSAAGAYSVTYFVSVITRGRGTTLCWVLILNCTTLGDVWGWWRAHVPSPLVRPYYAAAPFQAQHAHLVQVCMLIPWIACSFAFVYVTQIAFDRMDI